jgi:hypothetical protein
MGFMDRAEDALEKGVDSHGEKVGDGVDRAARLADDKTGGKHGDQLDQGADKVKDALDGLDGKDDDIS